MTGATPSEAIDATLVDLSATEAAALIASGSLSPAELTEAYLDRIERCNSTLTAYVEVTAARARADARLLTDELAHGQARSPLHGIPVGLKDLIDTAGIPTQAGSAAYRGRIPQADATVARRLREAGTVLLGKLATHELAFGLHTSNPKSYGTTTNPWDLERIPGGSSGGAGAAVAARLVCASVGTDTAGSIRVPASFCGCVGFKPTFGVVSRAGIAPLSYFFDHAGPLARTVADAALVLDAISGYDPDDAATLPGAGTFAAALPGDPRGLRVGVARDRSWTAVHPGVRAAAEAALARLEDLGMHLVDVTLPSEEALIEPLFAVIAAEARDAHREVWPSQFDQFGPDVQTLMAIPCLDGDGTIAAMRAVADYTHKLRLAFEAVDLIASPTVPIVAPPLGAEIARIDGVDVPVVNAAISNTFRYNLAHLPAVSVPCGFSGDLPVGLQLAGGPFGDARVLQAAHAYEQSTGWHRQVPPVASW